MKKANLSLTTGIIITLIYLLFNLITINDYGLTWDFSYHFNAGLWHLGKPLSDPKFIMGPSAPLPDILPVIAHHIFYEKLKLLPFDAAYNLYGVIMGSLGVGILYFAIRRLFNFPIAFISSIVLALLPRYFGHLHNNMKDIPQAAFFTLSIWMFIRLYRKPSVINLMIASLTFAISYNNKINAVFVLIIAIFFLLLISLKPIKSKLQLKFNESKLIIIYFLISPIASLLLWWPFWDNPLGRLKEAFATYTSSTINMPILYFGKMVYSGQNIPWHYPIGILSVTTPVLVLFFFLIGLFSLFTWQKLKTDNRLFLLLWFVLPLTRYLKPHMIVIDDIRHFMEVVFPLSAISGIGIYRVYKALTSISVNIFPRINKLLMPVGYLSLIISYLFFQIISYHPYQTNYFSELIGGVKGARGNFDIEFWAQAYKKALPYLNKNAPDNSKVTIPMAPDIARFYLRDDLKTYLNGENLASADPKVYGESDYTAILNRQSFFDWFGITAYLKNRVPIYSLTLHEVPLVSIYKN